MLHRRDSRRKWKHWNKKCIDEGTPTETNIKDTTTGRSNPAAAKWRCKLFTFTFVDLFRLNARRNHSSCARLYIWCTCHLIVAILRCSTNYEVIISFCLMSATCFTFCASRKQKWGQRRVKKISLLFTWWGDLLDLGMLLLKLMVDGDIVCFEIVIEVWNLCY